LKSIISLIKSINLAIYCDFALIEHKSHNKAMI